jgi:hypothetical protein
VWVEVSCSTHGLKRAGKRPPRAYQIQRKGPGRTIAAEDCRASVRGAGGPLAVTTPVYPTDPGWANG